MRRTYGYVLQSENDLPNSMTAPLKGSKCEIRTYTNEFYLRYDRGASIDPKTPHYHRHTASREKNLLETLGRDGSQV
jgi:hypothetical protein